MRVIDKFFINGEWATPNGTNTIDVINPANASVYGRIPQGTAADVNSAVAAAKAAFPSWSKTPTAERSALIRAIALKMQERIPEIAETIVAEQGSPIGFASQVQAGLPSLVMESFADYTFEMDHVEQVDHSMVVREAIGVCGLIVPWNYPLQLLVTKVAPALAAGCTIVIKPSEVTPFNAFMLAEIVHAAGLPPGVLNLVTGYGADVGEALCRHPDVDMISFTGSTAVGKRILAMGADDVKRVCVELGGKSATVVLEDADISAAMTGNVVQVMSNSGQTCFALSRVFVPASRYDDAVAAAKAVAESLVVGDPSNEATQIGPLVSLAQRERVLGYIEKGIQEGARMVTGGGDVPEELRQGFYVKPTVFADVRNDMVIAREEIFGPVICLIPYNTVDEAVAMANDSPYGLAASVWSADTGKAVAVSRRLIAGQVFINDAEFNMRAPFGGFKQSGNGRELGSEGLREYFELKAIHMPTASA